MKDLEPFAVRSLAPQDLPKLPQIELVADQVFASHGIHALPPPASLEAYENALFVLVAGDPPVGFSRAIEIDGAAHLEQISVIPEHARHGIGGRLLTASVEAARRIGKSRMTLITFAGVPWNEPFYLRNGFRRLERLTIGLQRLREREKMLGLDQLGKRVVLERGLANAN